MGISVQKSASSKKNVRKGFDPEMLVLQGTSVHNVGYNEDTVLFYVFIKKLFSAFSQK